MVISKQDFKRFNKEKPIKYNIDLLSWNNLCRYVIQDSTFVRIEHLSHLRDWLNTVDPEEYENDNEKSKRVRFIFKALEARIDNNITSRDLIFTHINGGIQFNIDFLDYDNLDMSKDEIIYLNNYIHELLVHSYIYKYTPMFLNISTEIQTRDFLHRGNIIQYFEELIQDANNTVRKSKVDDNFVDSTFSLCDDVFDNVITNVWNMATNPSRRLITGMQGLNKMIGGGFESGRVYMFLGTAGAGKSMTLLNLMKQIKDYNPHIKTKDPTKKPAIVMLTMENTMNETVQRMFNMYCPERGEMADNDLEDVKYYMKYKAGMNLTESSPMDIQIKYKPNRSVNTSYLDSLYDDLLENGYEMVCLIQDHVKRIRSIERTDDLRIELGNVVNEMKNFASVKDIPVITVSHLNRDGAKAIEEAARKANQDAGRLLGKANVGESMLMIDNIDFGIIMTKEFDKQQRPYMVFSAIKQRTRCDLSYFAQPYLIEPSISNGFGLRFQEDLGTIPCYKESVHGAPELNQHSTVKISGASSLTANINDVLDISDEDRKNGMFASQSYKLSHSDNPTTIPDPMEAMNEFENDLESAKADINKFAKLQDAKMEFGSVEDDSDYSSPIIRVDELEYVNMQSEFKLQKQEFMKKFGVGA